jgi:hypothetical protein
MMNSSLSAALAPNTVCFSVDVEWAAQPVLDDVRNLFDQHGVAATFFVTHAGVSVPGHERGLHPNFFRNGDTYRAFADAASKKEAEIYDHVVSTTLAFAPEAKGVRTHRLFYDSLLLPFYQRHGLEYDGSIRLPLVENLRPFRLERGLVEVPAYYADYFDMVTLATGFEVNALRLDAPGLKVFDFHPNLVFLNSPDEAHYLGTKSFYHDPERLLAARHTGKGVRTLFLDLLAAVVKRRLPVATLGQVAARWRETEPPRRGDLLASKARFVDG